MNKPLSNKQLTTKLNKIIYKIILGLGHDEKFARKEATANVNKIRRVLFAAKVPIRFTIQRMGVNNIVAEILEKYKREVAA